MGNPQPEHECRQNRKCKARVRDNENNWHGAGVEDPGKLCRPCEEHAFAAIRELAGDYDALLAARTEEGSRGAAPKVSGSSEPPIPIRLGPDSLAGEIDNEVTRWAVRLLRGNPIPNGDPFPVVTSMLGTLIDLAPQRVTTWVPHPDGGDDYGEDVLDGVDAVLRLARLHARAQAMLGLTETTTFLPDPCPHCARKGLAVSKDQERVTCKACQIVWDSAHFALLSSVLDFERRSMLA